MAFSGVSLALGRTGRCTVSDEEEDEIKRGKRGGRWHGKPGRGHARKSAPPKKRRTGKRLAAKNAKKKADEEWKQEWFDSLDSERKKYLTPNDAPPRPEDQQ
jgi:hypothetical protein